MEKTNDKARGTLDSITWLIVVVLVSAGVIGNAYFDETYPLLYRVLALIGLAIVAGGIALTTTQGRAFSELLKDAYGVELRKIVWPTQAETRQTTLIVLIVVALMALFLWGLDSALSFFVKLLIG